MSSVSMPAMGERNIKLGSWLMAVAGAGFVAYGIIFFVRNFSSQFLELGIGPEQVPVGRDEINQFSPDLFHYISHLHIAISGFLAAIGIAVAALALRGVRTGARWAWWTAVVTAVVAVGVALPAHYPWGFATIGHLGLIYLAVVIFVVGAAMTLRSEALTRPRASQTGVVRTNADGYKPAGAGIRPVTAPQPR